MAYQTKMMVTIALGCCAMLTCSAALAEAIGKAGNRCTAANAVIMPFEYLDSSKEACSKESREAQAVKQSCSSPSKCDLKSYLKTHDCIKYKSHNVCYCEGEANSVYYVEVNHSCGRSRDEGCDGGWGVSCFFINNSRYIAPYDPVSGAGI